MGMRNYFWLVKHRAESPSPVFRNHLYLSFGSFCKRITSGKAYPGAQVHGYLEISLCSVHCNSPAFNRIRSILSIFYVFPVLFQFLTNHIKIIFSVAIEVILLCLESISKAMHCFSVFWPQVSLKYIFALREACGGFKFGVLSTTNLNELDFKIKCLQFKILLCIRIQCPFLLGPQRLNN